MRKIDTTFFNKRKENDLPFIRRGTNESLCEDFNNLIKMEFEMSKVGELTFFHGLQINQQVNVYLLTN